MRRFSFDIICKFSFEIDTECFIPSFLDNVVVAAYMKTETITEHWFGEEAEGSDRSGEQCGYGDVRVEEEADGNNNDES
ncbi:hypothetical protein AHAS_Ahas05G0199700 [Arachis hypogaea]